MVTGSRIDARAERARARGERRALAREEQDAPKSASVLRDQGLAYAKAGDDRSALAALDKAVKAAPEDAALRYQRSLVLRRLGKTKRADADAARAAELDPRYKGRSE